MKVLNDPIPKKHFAKWLEIFKATSGRFLSNPIDIGDVYRVSYTFVDCDDYQRLNEEFAQVTTNIVEKDTRYLRWWRRLMGWRK